MTSTPKLKFGSKILISQKTSRGAERLEAQPWSVVSPTGGPERTTFLMFRYNYLYKYKYFLQTVQLDQSGHPLPERGQILSGENWFSSNNKSNVCNSLKN